MKIFLAKCNIVAGITIREGATIKMLIQPVGVPFKRDLQSPVAIILNRPEL